MTPKLSSYYRKNSLNAAVLTQQQLLLNGLVHSQTQAGNTNASPPRRPRSKVQVTSEMFIPSLASALHKKDRTLPATLGTGQRQASLARGQETVTAFQARSLPELWRGRMGGMEPREPFGSFPVSVVYLYVPLFFGSCRVSFCSDFSGLNLVQLLCSLATCKFSAIQLMINAHEESRAASLLAPGHRSSTSHSSTSGML